MKLLQGLFCLTISTLSSFTYAISIGSISDAIENNSNLGSMKRTTSQTVSAQTPRESGRPHGSAPTKAFFTAEPASEKKLPNPALFIEDSAMTAYIHAKLIMEKSIPSVNVTTANAVVSLVGTVDTQEQADKLVEIASSVKGVKYVDTDNLKVRG